MALKDLVAQRAALTEDSIEEIVSNYIRYDLEEKAIAFTSAAAKLQNRAKLLVYLVALQGWPFVTEEAVSVDAKPGELSDQTGIPGGSLRPLLKELKEQHFIAERGGRYLVRPMSLASIRVEICGEGGSPTQRRHVRKRKISAEKSKALPQDKGLRRTSPAKKSGGLAARLNSWISAGFFHQPKTLADAQKRFQREGVIVPQSRVSPYLLGAVRSGQLTREEAEVNKKRVWAYRSAT
jgi:hypothetical protein